MIRATVTRKPQSEAQFVERLRGQSKAFARQQAVVLGESMVRECVAIVSEEFEPGGEDRKAGAHLVESFMYVIDDKPNGADVTLTIKPGVSAKKVAALEYGAKADYEIRPSGVVFGQQGVSVSRSRARRLTNLGMTGTPTRLLRWNDPATGKDKFAPVVTHKAFPGRHFMQRAMEAAVDKMRARSGR